MWFNHSFEQLAIRPSNGKFAPVCSFINNFDGALFFLRSCPSHSVIQQDIYSALADERVNSPNYSKSDLFSSVAQLLADGRLIVTNRYTVDVGFDNFKRKPAEPVQSLPPVAPPPPAKPKSAIEFKSPKSKPEIDISAQIAILTAARKHAVPFCEVCEKALG